jgi:uncharacterized protein
MQITVAYATPDKQVEIPLTLEKGASIEAAIEASCICELFPDIDSANLQVGVFGKRAKLSDSLSDHDRVEIYRPLQVSPMQARRLRAAKKAKG